MMNIFRADTTDYGKAVLINLEQISHVYSYEKKLTVHMKNGNIVNIESYHYEKLLKQLQKGNTDE